MLHLLPVERLSLTMLLIQQLVISYFKCISLRTCVPIVTLVFHLKSAVRYVAVSMYRLERFILIVEANFNFFNLLQMNAMYEYVLAKRKAMEAQARALEAGLNIKPKYEYDSDEDVEGGTWEHKRRTAEMTATKGTKYCIIKHCGIVL